MHNLWFKRRPYNTWKLLYSDTSVFEHKETILIKLEFEKSLILKDFLLIILTLFLTLHYCLCFILYYFRTSYIINIRKCQNIDQGLFEMHYGKWYITDFCVSIVCGWCYFEFLKGNSWDNFLDFQVHLCL